ncbi:MAG: hypothetical protein ACK5M7_01230, partial [Draconibacterium sp.]
PTVSLAFELRDKLLKISWIFLNLVHVSKINLYLTKRDKQFYLIRIKIKSLKSDFYIVENWCGFEIQDLFFQ